MQTINQQETEVLLEAVRLSAGDVLFQPHALAGADHRLMLQVIMGLSALTVPCDAPREQLGTQALKTVRVVLQLAVVAVVMVVVVQPPRQSQPEAQVKWLSLSLQPLELVTQPIIP